MSALLRNHPGAVIGVALPALVGAIALLVAVTEGGDEESGLAVVNPTGRVRPERFQPLNQLEELIVRSNGDPSASGDFNDALLEATVWVVSQENLENARREKRTTVPFQHVAFRGQSMLPIYTTRARVPDDIAADRVGTLPFRTILGAMSPASPVVVNPESWLPLPLNVQQIHALRAEYLGIEPPEPAEGAMPMAAAPLEPARALEPMALPSSLAEPLPLIEPLRPMFDRASDRIDAEEGGERSAHPRRHRSASGARTRMAPTAMRRQPSAPNPPEDPAPSAEPSVP